MAPSRKGKGKGTKKNYDSDEGVTVPVKRKKSPLDKGKSIVRDDDEEEDYENAENLVDETAEDEEEEEEEEEDGEEEEAGYSSGEGIRVTRTNRHKRIKERFELDEEDYDLLEEANVTGFHRPANLGGKFKRLKKADHVPGRKDSGALHEKRDYQEEEESEDEEMEIEDDEELDDEEHDEYKLISKSRKKGGRRGAQKRNKGSGSSLGERRRVERETLANLNAMTADSDDNYGDDRVSLARSLLDKQFESSLPEVNYFTPRDDLLRQTDVPERLQILEEAAEALPSSDFELRQTAEWIFDRAFGDLCIPTRPEFQHLLNVEKPEIVSQIANILHLVHNEKLEVPFIGLYRREECLDIWKEECTDAFAREDEPAIRQYKALWAVQEWNKKWLLLQRHKSELRVSFQERVGVDFSSTSETDGPVRNIFRFIEEAESEEVLDDFDAQFNLLFPRDESVVVDSRFKRPRFRSLYSVGHQAGLGSITKYFGLTSGAFAENVKSGYKKHDILDEAFLPDDLAAKFSSSSRSRAEFKDTSSLIRGARHMLATEISSEPSVRQYVRTFYSKNAVITTKPTPVGIDAIDAFHQFEIVKWIHDKPISAFDDEQWLLVQKAEEEKLIDVTVGLPKESIDSILFECEQFFLSDGVSLTSQSWNEQRKQILREAVVTLLLPIMEKETRMSLVTRAKQLLVAKCALQLWNKVSVAPYNPASDDNMQCRNEDGPTLRVLACCWGPPSTGTTFVMLDADGEILNTMHTGYLNIKAFSPEQTQRKENDKARLMKVLTVYKPHIIVLGAAKVQCRYLSQDVSDVLFMLVEQHAGDLAEGLDNIKLVYGDESIPSLFEASRISQNQLPGQPGTVRRAVALGRFLQNPVAMVASFFGPSREILSIKFHPLQSFLSSEELYDVLERVMITVVNQVGIDINLAVMHGWLFETLQFVAGLGPRKAEVIRTALTMARRVQNRNDLCSTIRAMGESVFNNCAGFVRVRGIGQTSSESPQHDPLDNTRIHPESYQMARDFAEAAIEKEARQKNEEADICVSQTALEHVMKNPNVLDTVDIEEYAQSIQVEGRSKRIQTLGLIKSELQRCFQEWRKPYSEPTNEDCFYLMTGESDETLFPGRIVQATVRKVQERQVMCVLECGLLGFIQKEDLSDDCDVEPNDKFTEGSLVTCRVKEVKMDKYLVDLTCKESDLQGNLSRDLHNHDKHFKPDTTFILHEREKTRKMKEEENKKKTFKPRPIVHPKFQNLSTEDATEALAEKDVGDFIIRPSYKGPAHLSITMKVSSGVFSHIDVAESNKENWDLASFLRLGKTLTIGDESYKSIDEVIAKHVNQVVVHLQAMLQFRKYREGNKLEIADALRSEKTENPKIIPYCFSIAHEYCGAFMLSYVRTTFPCHEYISLEPSGFRFRKKVFDTVDKLVVYFKGHFHDPIPSRATNWGEGGRGRGERGRGRGDRGRGRGRGDRGRGRGDRGRGWGGRDSRSEKGSDRFANDGEGPGWADNSNGKGNDSWGDDRGNTRDNKGGDSWHDPADGGGGSSWGNNRGSTSDTKGGDNWNDSANGGGDSAWGVEGGMASNTEGGAGGWKDETNAAGGGGGWDSWDDPADGQGGAAIKAAGGGGGWDSWNDPADGQGGAATKAAGGGGGFDSWNHAPANRGGRDATNGASGGRGATWTDRNEKLGNTEGEDSVWKGVTNAAVGGADWDIDKGDTEKVQDENITKTAEIDSAWDCGSKSTNKANDGWDSVPASGGGWDAVEGGHDDVSGGRSGGSGKRRWNESARGSDKGRGNESAGGYRSGGSDKGRWNENAGGGGEGTKRGGSDQWGPSSPVKRTAPSSWNNRDSDGQDGGKPASNTASTGDAWGSVTNSAGRGGDGWDTLPVPETELGGWDAVQIGDKGGSNTHDGGAGASWNENGRDGRSNSRGRDQALVRRQESSGGWDSPLPPAAPSNRPVQNSWDDWSKPPASTGDGWGQSPAEQGPDATVVSGGDSGWGAPEKEKTETAGPDWGAVDAVADPWGSVGGGSSSGGWGQDGAATGNDQGWNRQQSQRGDGHWSRGGGRGSQNDGGRWGSREGRGGGGPREGRGHDDGGRWGSRGARGDRGRWESRGGRGSQNDGGRWGSE